MSSLTLDFDIYSRTFNGNRAIMNQALDKVGHVRHLAGGYDEKTELLLCGALYHGLCSFLVPYRAAGVFNKEDNSIDFRLSELAYLVIVPILAIRGHLSSQVKVQSNFSWARHICYELLDLNGWLVVWTIVEENESNPNFTIKPRQRDQDVYQTPVRFADYNIRMIRKLNGVSVQTTQYNDVESNNEDP